MNPCCSNSRFSASRSIMVRASLSVWHAVRQRQDGPRRFQHLVTGGEHRLMQERRTADQRTLARRRAQVVKLEFKAGALVGRLKDGVSREPEPAHGAAVGNNVPRGLEFLDEKRSAELLKPLARLAWRDTQAHRQFVCDALDVLSRQVRR